MATASTERAWAVALALAASGACWGAEKAPAAVPVVSQEPAVQAQGEAGGANAPNSADSALIAFSSNLRSRGSCHRDARDGADLFVGSLDLDTGQLTDLRLVDGSSGAQWFPGLSPDGRYLAYNSSSGRGNKLYLADLATMEKRVILDKARFPAFSPDGGTIYYSVVPQASIHAYELASSSSRSLGQQGMMGDPCPVGTRWIASHALINGRMAKPALYDLQSGEQRIFDAPRFGHLAASPAGDAILAGDAVSSRVRVARLQGGIWSGFQPLVDQVGDQIEQLDPGFSAGGAVLLSYASWPRQDLLVVTAQATLPRSGGRGLPKTARARLFMVDISSSAPRMLPITLPEHKDLGFELHSLGSDLLAGRGMEGIGGESCE